jgi:hypothetical protein
VIEGILGPKTDILLQEQQMMNSLRVSTSF